MTAEFTKMMRFARLDRNRSGVTASDLKFQNPGGVVVLFNKLCTSLVRPVVAAALMLTAMPAQADLIAGVPTNWRLQD